MDTVGYCVITLSMETVLHYSLLFSHHAQRAQRAFRCADLWIGGRRILGVR